MLLGGLDRYEIMIRPSTKIGYAQKNANHLDRLNDGSAEESGY
jgi:hypothetical protein